MQFHHRLHGTVSSFHELSVLVDSNHLLNEKTERVSVLSVSFQGTVFLFVDTQWTVWHTKRHQAEDVLQELVSMKSEQQALYWEQSDREIIVFFSSATASVCLRQIFNSTFNVC